MSLFPKFKITSPLPAISAIPAIPAKAEVATRNEVKSGQAAIPAIPAIRADGRGCRNSGNSRNSNPSVLEQKNLSAPTRSGAPTLGIPIATVNRAPPAATTVATRPSGRAVINRQDMPQIAAVVDQLRAVFGPVQVVFASEGGKELGREPSPGVIAHPVHVPNKPRKRGQL